MRNTAPPVLKTGPVTRAGSASARRVAEPNARSTRSCARVDRAAPYVNQPLNNIGRGGTRSIYSWATLAGAAPFAAASVLPLSAAASALLLPRPRALPLRRTRAWALRRAPPLLLPLPRALPGDPTALLHADELLALYRPDGGRAVPVAVLIG